MQTAAIAELGRLDAFVGIWDTEGEVVAGPLGQPVIFKATDTYEWLPGGYFLLHRYDAKMPDGNVVGIEVIGYDRENDSYTIHSFDNQGNASVMQGRFENDTWTFAGESMRFTGKFSDNDMVITGVWEMRAGEGFAWQPWMQVTLKKI